MQSNFLKIFSFIALSFSAKSLMADPADCYRATPSSLNAALSVELCSGAIDSAPVACYRSTPSSLSATLSVKLCKSARSSAPATCYRATPNSLNADLSVNLCVNAVDSSPVTCYRKTPSSLSAVNSVSLCKIDPIRPYSATTSRFSAASSVTEMNEVNSGTKMETSSDTKEMHLTSSDLKNANYVPKAK